MTSSYRIWFVDNPRGAGTSVICFSHLQLAEKRDLCLFAVNVSSKRKIHISLSHPVSHINIEVKSIFQLAIFTLKTPLFRGRKFLSCGRRMWNTCYYHGPMVLHKKVAVLYRSGLNYSIGHI